MMRSRLQYQSRSHSPFSKDYLPLPASGQPPTGRGGLHTLLRPLVLRKIYLKILLFNALVALTIYSLRSRNSRCINSSLGATIPSRDGLGNGFVAKHVENLALTNESHRLVPEDNDFIQIRGDPHPNPHITLPEETVFGNPWPENDEIVNLWLNDERLARVPFGPPDRSTLSEDAADKTPKRLPKEQMVKESSFMGKGTDWPKIQKQGCFDGSEHDIKIRLARRDWVKRAFLHAWKGYKTQAWGHDQVSPISGGSSDQFNGWGATIVDSLSTLLIMNLTEEYSFARTHVRQIDFTTYPASPEFGDTVPVFETIIRYLGGMISAYDLTDGKDTLMLERAEELAGWLMGAFDTKYGLPVGRYSIPTRLQGRPAGRGALAEVGSFSLEFGRLAQITGKNEYYEIVHRAGEFLQYNEWKGVILDVSKALLPGFVDDGKGQVDGTYGCGLRPSRFARSIDNVNVDAPSQPRNAVNTVGAPSDSYYEYLLKASLLFRNSTPISSLYSTRYFSALDSAYSTGLIAPVKVVPGAENKDLTIFGQLSQYGVYSPTLEHLACFAGGLVATGSRVLTGREKDLETGKRFTETCFWAYNATYTGLGPAILTFHSPSDMNRFSGLHIDPLTSHEYLKVSGNPAGWKSGDGKYQGRPETVESVWYLWRITGDREWQEKGWAMFAAWIEHTIVPFGFAGIDNVNSANYRHVDTMESFVFAETLKYYYLLFSDPDYVSLDEFVLNTEAHPLRLPFQSADGRASSYTSPWVRSELDDRLQEECADPHFADTGVVGMGTFVQQMLCRSKN